MDNKRFPNNIFGGSAMKKIFSLFLVLAIVASAVFAGGQQDGAGASYPERPINVIIPYAPGGGSDTLVRSIMRFIQMPNGHPWVAINVDGAGGFTGAMRAYNSPSDGYTIFTHNTGDLIAYYQAGQDNIPILLEGTTIALMVTDYSVISTNPISSREYGWRTIDDVAAWSRANPNVRLRWGVSGTAQGDNMINSIRVARALGIYDNINFIAYDSGAAVRTAGMSNEVHISMNTASEIPGVVSSGDAIPLVVVNDQRIRLLPDTPSTAEKGLDATMTKPRGIFGPKGMNPEHVRILTEALRTVSQNPEFIALMQQLGFDVVFVEGQRARDLASRWLEELRPFHEELRGR